MGKEAPRIGVDLIEIERVERLLKRQPRFLTRCFSLREQAELAAKGNRAQSVAGAFAAKEAVSKALGEGFRNIGLCDIEILHAQSGRPYIVLSEAAQKRYLVRSEEISISISHNRTSAMAFALIAYAF